MVDDSINMANDVERHNANANDTESRNELARTRFIVAAQLGDMAAHSPINYGQNQKYATVSDMMDWSLQPRGYNGVTLATVFAYLCKMSKEDDEAMAMLETMADQFVWSTT